MADFVVYRVTVIEGVRVEEPYTEMRGMKVNVTTAADGLRDANILPTGDFVVRNGDGDDAPIAVSFGERG